MFKAKDPEQLYSWYERHLGITRHPDGGVVFNWGPNEPDCGRTTWAIFPTSTDYFKPSDAGFMINFRVDDLDSLLQTLRDEGVWIDERREEYDYGRFAWIMDPEGNRVELWQPLPDRGKRYGRAYDVDHRRARNSGRADDTNMQSHKSKM